jgi:hypothetical protein
MFGSRSANRKPDRIFRWECQCRRPPLLLAEFDLSGRVMYSDPERYWQIEGRIVTNCPGCGKQHLLYLELRPDIRDGLPLPWSPPESGQSKTRP